MALTSQQYRSHILLKHGWPPKSQPLCYFFRFKGVRFNSDVSFYNSFHIKAHSWDRILFEFPCRKDIEKCCFATILQSDQCNLHRTIITSNKKQMEPPFLFARKEIEASR